MCVNSQLGPMKSGRAAFQHICIYSKRYIMSSTQKIVTLLVLISIAVLFHLAVLTHIIPYNIAWGGRLQNDSEMYVFESISIIINLLLIYVLLSKGQLIKSKMKPKVVNICLWIFLVLFSLNTIGNLFAQTNFEKAFSFVTLIFAALIGLILRTPQSGINSKK